MEREKGTKKGVVILRANKQARGAKRKSSSARPTVSSLLWDLASVHNRPNKANPTRCFLVVARRGLPQNVQGGF